MLPRRIGMLSRSRLDRWSGGLAGVWIRRQRASFRDLLLLKVTVGSRRLWLCNRLVGFWARVVECDFNSDVASVFALACESLPLIALAAAGYDDVAQIDPCLTYQFSLFVVVEY